MVPNGTLAVCTIICKSVELEGGCGLSIIFLVRFSCVSRAFWDISSTVSWGSSMEHVLCQGGRHAAHLQAILLTLSASEESEGHVHSEKEGRGWTGLESSTYV